ncbi:unnamed protein product [Rotaria sp. Silwood1]|nr:unnamed protein product [Rotaria sp. Silwood1]
MTYFISVYLGYFIVIIGVIGNIINILVFTQLKLFRRNQSAFYLTIASIVDSFQLIFAMSTRITATVIGFDLTRTSLIWCKLRVYLIRSTRIISITTICFAAIDQYLSTNSHIQLRQLSTFKLAQRLIIGLLPIFISSLFSLLAYQNVRRIIRRQMSIVRRRLDRQLTAMILLRNIINILVFTQLKLFRRNQSAFYLIIASIVDSCQLILGIDLVFDVTRTSLIWCKLQAYFAQFTRIISTIIICFAAIDQYLSTNYYIQLRPLSTLKLAQHLIGILIIFSFLYCIPFLVFHEIHPNTDCTTFNPIFNSFFSFFHYSILVGTLPIFISSLFSLLAYRNVRRIIRHQMSILRRRLDRQLTAMILLRVTLFVIASLPHTSYEIYELNNPVVDDHSYSAVLSELIEIIFITILKINYSGSFFIFLISSSRFRRQVKFLLYRKVKCNCLPIRMNRNQVIPENQLQSVEYIRSSTPINS